ncbi:MAG: serine/threonine protein kinase [bacterium]|nr:serine/threonine protein kinase [bacterium]
MQLKNTFIHRDIKPSNLLVTSERIVEIMDFGLAKMVEEVRRATTIIGGTPNYMAPEQAVGEATDHRADLYALGGTLFHLLTGSVPYETGDVTYQHAHGPVPDPRERELSVPAPLAELVMKLMAKAPEDRPQTAREVGVALQAYLKASG